MSLCVVLCCVPGPSLFLPPPRFAGLDWSAVVAGVVCGFCFDVCLSPLLPSLGTRHPSHSRHIHMIGCSPSCHWGGVVPPVWPWVAVATCYSMARSPGVTHPPTKHPTTLHIAKPPSWSHPFGTTRHPHTLHHHQHQRASTTAPTMTACHHGSDTQLDVM